MAILVQVTQHYTLLRTDQADLTEVEAKAFVNALKGLPSSDDRSPLVVFDLSSARSLSVTGMRMFTRTVGVSRESETRYAVVAGREVTKIISDLGLERLFPCYPSLEAIIGAPKGDDSRQKTLEFLNTTLEAVANTLAVSTNTTVQAAKPFIRGQGGADPGADIAAMVGIFGTAFHGTLILAFPTSTFVKIMSRFIGDTYTEITPVNRDGVAELLNIVLGHAKTLLNERGYGIRQAIPTVVQGRDMKLAPTSSTLSVIVPFSSDVGGFYVELVTNPPPRSP